MVSNENLELSGYIVNSLIVLVHQAMGHIRYFTRKYLIRAYNPLGFRPWYYTPVLHTLSCNNHHLLYPAVFRGNQLCSLHSKEPHMCGFFISFPLIWAGHWICFCMQCKLKWWVPCHCAMTLCMIQSQSSDQDTNNNHPLLGSKFWATDPSVTWMRCDQVEMISPMSHPVIYHSSSVWVPARFSLRHI